jgi:N-acetylated-alpha-linked acidic dipeptidase
VDHAVTGPHFSAQASPLLNRLIVDVTTMIIDPKTSKSVYESWLDRFISEALERDDEDEEYTDPLVQPIGTTPGLDSLAFFEHAGISSLSMSFDSNKYHLSHSAFDS